MCHRKCIYLTKEQEQDDDVDEGGDHQQRNHQTILSNPSHLTNLKLSLLDQIFPMIFTSIVLFYPLHGSGDPKIKFAERSQRLKKSLSQTLTHFYPLAGRVKDNTSIDCNDDGAEYIEARVNCRLSDILQIPEVKVLDNFLPTDTESTDRVLLVLATSFECSGMTLGVSISHKITDASSLSTFIKSWATATAADEYSGEMVLPKFNTAYFFSPTDSSITLPPLELTKDKCVTRRYVFDASKIALLKTKAASASVPQPTRVEAVSALIWKCATTASRSNLGYVRPSLMAQFMNLRKKIALPLFDNSMGNFIWPFCVRTEESAIELHSLVSQSRKGIENFHANDANTLAGDKGFSMICELVAKENLLTRAVDMDVFLFSSWCRFPLYEGDFGWGNPAWMSVTGMAFKNVVILTDTRDREGVEALVTLSEENMALFECDQDLHAFAALNSSVLY